MQVTFLNISKKNLTIQNMKSALNCLFYVKLIYIEVLESSYGSYRINESRLKMVVVKNLLLEETKAKAKKKNYRDQV